MTDPNFSRRGQRAYLGKSLWSRPFTQPAMGIGQLPPLSAVVLSHPHGDHFDQVARRGLDRAVPIVTTPETASSLQRYGFRTRGLDRWPTHELVGDGEGVRIESVPAVHARGPLRPLLPPVMG